MVHAAGGARGGARAAPRGVGAGGRRRGPPDRGARARRRVGKTRLVAAIADEVRAAGGCVVVLHGSPFHTGAGFHPVRTLIESRSGIADHAESAERLARLSDELVDLGLDPAQAVPLLSPLLEIDRAPATTRPRRRAASWRSRSRGPCWATSSPVREDSQAWSWRRTCTGSTALLMSARRPDQVWARDRAGHRNLARSRAWAVGRHRAAAAHAPGPARGSSMRSRRA